MRTKRQFEISVEANEVVIGPRRLQVRASAALEPETARGALGLEAGRGSGHVVEQGADGDARTRRGAAGRAADARRRRARHGARTPPERAHRGSVLRQRLARQDRREPPCREHGPPAGRPAGDDAGLRRAEARGPLHRGDEGRRPAQRPAGGAGVRPSRRANRREPGLRQDQPRAPKRVRQASSHARTHGRRPARERAHPGRHLAASPGGGAPGEAREGGNGQTPARRGRARQAHRRGRRARRPATPRERGERAAARSSRASRLRGAVRRRRPQPGQAERGGRGVLPRQERRAGPGELDEDRPVRHRPVEPRSHRQGRQRRGLRRRAGRDDRPLDHGAASSPTRRRRSTRDTRTGSSRTSSRTSHTVTRPAATSTRPTAWISTRSAGPRARAGAP